jgi:hypothetical protein
MEREVPTYYDISTGRGKELYAFDINGNIIAG